MSGKNSVFGEEVPESDRIFFVPDDGLMERPQRAEQSAPRPLPQAVDRDAEAWIPGGKVKTRSIASILGRVGVGVFSIAILIGLFFVVYKVFTAYTG